MEKKKPEGWEGIVWECERLLECPDHAESPLMSNLPNLIRDRIVRSQEDQDKKTQSPKRQANCIRDYCDRIIELLDMAEEAQNCGTCYNLTCPTDRDCGECGVLKGFPNWKGKK